MKITLSWLREFVDVPGTAADIAAAMSVRGFAVEGIEPLGEDDAVIDFEITANRPDCMSVMGMAREVATAYGLQVRRPAIRGRSGRDDRAPDRKTGTADAPQSDARPTDGAESSGSGGGISPAHGPGLHLTALKTVERGDIDILIDSPDLCPRYAGAMADVTVGDAPEWMQNRLRSAGVRPISNIVDVTNYVLLELGQPMHAFDHARLGGGQIRVRTAQPGETIRTLDGQTRMLTADMLVIADASRPVAVAGVMGGADSEVSRGTTAIVLESAYFDPLSVRRTSKKLGLKTEASMRFERGADPRLPVTAMERACALLEIVGAGRARGTVVDRHVSRIEPRMLRLRRSRVGALLGIEIAETDMRRILESLGFALREAGDGWDVTVPTRRVDVLREVDLIEEIARHYGFDRIPPTFPALVSTPPPVDPRVTRTRQLRTVLTGAAFSEAVTFGFIPAPVATPFATEGDVVSIANPLSETFAVLRPSVLPGLIDAVAYNRRREQRDVRLFEIGARFSQTAGERQALACVWTGAAVTEHWSGTGRDVDFFDMKGLVDRVADALGLEVTTATASVDWLVPGRSAAIVSSGARLGLLGQLSPALGERHGLPLEDPVYVAEVDLDAADAVARPRVAGIQPLPRHPSVTRDVSVLVDAGLAAETVRQTIRDAAPQTLVRVREFDRYQGKGIPEDKVSLSLHLVFRSPDRTLTDSEVQGAMDAVISALQARHDAVRR